MPVPEGPIGYGFLESPVGRLLIAGTNRYLVRICFPVEHEGRPVPADWRRDDAAIETAVGQLRQYFAGHRTRFDLPLRFAGTAFQTRVWSALRDIAFGETLSYGGLAVRIGRPKASRAVGAANGANPLPIVVPCHRVIGADRSLTGFGGGLDAKRFLLAHEQRIVGAEGRQACLAV